jgi:hypothetical protein
MKKALFLLCVILPTSASGLAFGSDFARDMAKGMAETVGNLRGSLMAKTGAVREPKDPDLWGNRYTLMDDEDLETEWPVEKAVDWALDAAGPLNALDWKMGFQRLPKRKTFISSVDDFRTVGDARLAIAAAARPALENEEDCFLHLKNESEKVLLYKRTNKEHGETSHLEVLLKQWKTYRLENIDGPWNVGLRFAEGQKNTFG